MCFRYAVVVAPVVVLKVSNIGPATEQSDSLILVIGPLN